MGKVKGKAAKTLKKKTANRSKRPPSDALFGPLVPSSSRSRRPHKNQQQQQQHSNAFHRSASFASTASGRTKKRSNNKRKGPPSRSSSFASNNSSTSVQLQVQVQLPNGKDLSNVPWLQVQQQQNHPNHQQHQRQRKSNTTFKKKCRLPVDDIPVHWLQALDDELQAFADYVKLSSHEVAVRQALVDDFQLAAQQVFASSSSSSSGQAAQPRRQHKRWNSSNDNHEIPQQQQQQQQQQDPVGFQIFGSFATPAVCVFTSDVDLALHGVVPPLPETIAAQSAQSQKSSPQPSVKQPSKQEQAPANKKQARVLRWKQALAAMEEDNLAAPSPEPTRPTAADDDTQDTQESSAVKKR